VNTINQQIRTISTLDQRPISDHPFSEPYLNHPAYNMTEVNNNNNFYGLFVECVEDISFDGAASTEDDDWFLASVGKKSSKGSSVFGSVFKAVEKINMCESSDSLTSFASMSSMASANNMSQSDLVSLFTPQMMMGAVESLTLNNYASTNSLSSMDYITRGQSLKATPDTIIQFFFRALEIFINKSENDEDEEISVAEFPKFC
jgi:hypothetical protein